MKNKAKQVKTFFKDHWHWFVLGLVFVGFFLFTASFNYLTQSKDFVKWLSPDETANYTVAKLYAETGSLAFFEKYNLLAKDIIHPRSFRSDYGLIKPVSFLGLPLFYGKIASIFGSSILPYLTPIFGMFGLLFFYLIVKRIFGKENALLSTILASAFPIYTYYSARSMFHNVLFLAAFLAGLYFALRMIERKEGERSFIKKHWLGYLFALCSGLGFGLAIITRSSELLWMAPLIILLWIFNVRKVGIFRLFFFAYGIFTTVLPVIYWNTVLYGSALASGYPELTNALFSLQQSGTHLASTTIAGKWYDLKPIISGIKATIFHFGFKPAQSYRLFNAYVCSMFPWLYWSAAAGLLCFVAFFKKYSRSRWLYIILWLGLSALLVLYYGSWTFYDNPDPKSFTIGNSYTRYWLPLYFGALPLASLALITITKFVRFTFLIWALRIAAVLYVVYISIIFVWRDPAEGLAVSIQKQTTAKQEWSEVLNNTPSNSVIITRYSDKLLFPERKVVIGLFDDPNMINVYSVLAKRVPTYYYNFNYKDADLAYLNSGVLKQNSLELTPIKKITDTFTLYRLSALKSNK